MSGRKQDIIWLNFDRVVVPGKKGYRAKCKKCAKEMQGLVVRLKQHSAACQPLQEQVETINNVGAGTTSEEGSNSLKRNQQWSTTSWCIDSSIQYVLQIEIV